jgi:hypothetical protein
MGIYLDEPLAAMAAAAVAVGGAAVGAWWQRRRSVSSRPAARDDARLLEARFDRLEAIAEATALEMERVAEGQRFTTKLLAEGTPSGASPRWPDMRRAEHHTPH